MFSWWHCQCWVNCWIQWPQRAHCFLCHCILQKSQEGTECTTEGHKGFTDPPGFHCNCTNIFLSDFGKGFNKLLIRQDGFGTYLFRLKQPEAWTWKEGLTVFQTNKCWEQETEIQRGYFHIKDHWRYVFKIQMSHSLGPLQKSAGILTLFHTLKYWKLPMQVKLNTSNLHCRWGRWKACLRRKSFNWLAKLPDLNTCLQRFYA